MASSKDWRTQWTPIDPPEPTPVARTGWEPLEESFSPRRSEALDAAIFKSPELFRQAIHEQGRTIAREILTRAIKEGEAHHARPVKKHNLWAEVGGMDVQDAMWKGTEHVSAPATPGLKPLEAYGMWRNALPNFVNAGSNLHYYPPYRTPLADTAPKRKAYLEIDPTSPHSPAFIRALIARSEAGAFSLYQAKIHVQAFHEAPRLHEIRDVSAYHNLSCWYFADDRSFQGFLREVQGLAQEWSREGRSVLHEVPDEKYLTHGHALNGTVLFGKDPRSDRSFDQMRNDLLVEVACAAEEQPTLEHIGATFMKTYQKYFPGGRPSNWLDL